MPTEQDELAAALVSAGDPARAELIARSPHLADATLARHLKALYDSTKASDPASAAGASAALAVLARAVDHPEIRALSEWTSGMAALQISGHIERAIEHIDTANTLFRALSLHHDAAGTQVSKVYALAVLGHYDAAIECGLAARAELLELGEALAAGKVEQNLGNLYWRRDRYDEAERFYLEARQRFAAVDDQRELAQVEINLANVRTSQYRFADAAALYEQARARAEAIGAGVVQAIVEGNLGWLALFQGRYDTALASLERARRSYEQLGMPHESAIADLELADAYLELNLAPEAAAIYSRVTPTFAELGMRAEQAHALAQHARALLALGEFAPARQLLAQSHTQYEAEENHVGAALVSLAEAQIALRSGDAASAEHAAAAAELPLADAGAIGKALGARTIRGDAIMAQGRNAEARTILADAAADAAQHGLPQIEQACHTALGLLAASAGDTDGAERSFERAVALIEALRAPLQADEFRTAFTTDKLTPYHELMRLRLARGGPSDIAEAWRYAERARSRALLDVLGGQAPTAPHDAYEAGLHSRLDGLYAELGWFYNQINRAPEGPPRAADELRSLHAGVRERETAALEIIRQLAPSEQLSSPGRAPLDVAAIQRDLGDHSALVEYTVLDGELLAFVVMDTGVRVFRNLAREDDVSAQIQQLFFQIDALRYGAPPIRAHMGQLEWRARQRLERLYAMLLAPIEPAIGDRRLIVAPYRALHYVPFHALCDGGSYLIERREVVYTPSASVLHHCRSIPARPIQRALLVGLADEQTPRVREELAAIAPAFPHSETLLDGAATVAALRAGAPAADILHLASHGQFRPDNPRFSALRLSDGWLTVREAAGLDLHCRLVTLSACETGVSAVAPGDELLGLARGFLMAGAGSLLVSLWAVDDSATADFMARFYGEMQAGASPATALRAAQLHALDAMPHPFFWSPFVLIGNW